MVTNEFEVLVRRAHGHETVVRVAATSQAEASKLVQEQHQRGAGLEVVAAARAGHLDA